MKQNRSLAISLEIKDATEKNHLQLLSDVFPSNELQEDIPKNTRNRTYPVLDTLMTMVQVATLEDKSLKNAVSLYYTIHQKEREIVKNILEKDIQKQKEYDSKNPATRGRKKNYKVKMRKSLEKDISTNTAAYSKARKRVPVSMVDKLFEESVLKNKTNKYSHFHGHEVFIADGTYCQLQDTPELRKIYGNKTGKNKEGYPRILIEALTSRGTGQVYSYKTAPKTKSELYLFYGLLDTIPENAIYLADDLYNSYEIMAKAISKKIHFLIPAKRPRNYEVIEKLEDGDEIIKIKRPSQRAKWLPDKNFELPDYLIIRKIRCVSPDGKIYFMVTSLVDRKIKKEELQMLYLTRWDIEISIREVKTIMGINVLRSKTKEMVDKELKVSLSAYNLIRTIIYESIKGFPFSPEGDIIYKFYTHNKDVLIDKKGRIYSRWSTGRKRTKTTDNQTKTS